MLIDLSGHTSHAEERSRGWSLVDDGPLDMRLNPDYGMPASEWLHDLRKTIGTNIKIIMVFWVIFIIISFKNWFNNFLDFFCFRLGQ